MIGIIDWRIDQCNKTNVKFHFNTLANKKNILSEKPEIIIIATGGMPNQSNLEEGSNLACSTWDIISGNVIIEDEVILYDDNGAFPGLQAAEIISNQGSKLEIISPERFFSPEIGGLNYVPYAKTFIENHVKITIDKRIKKINKRDNRLLVSVGSDYSDHLDDILYDKNVLKCCKYCSQKF